MFDTYGPFVLRKHDKDGIDALYDRIRADETDSLQYGIGIYIIAAQGIDGELLPWYVGRTSLEFGARLKQHFDKGKFIDLTEKGPLSIFLIARANQGRIVARDERTGRDFIVIEQLEQELIDHCVKLNPDLLNKQRLSSKKLHVPGFKDDGESERDFAAAQALAKLLKT